MRPAMKAAAIAASGLSASGAVEWKGTPAASAYRAYPRLTISHGPSRAIGVDEERRRDGASPAVDDQTVTISGPRQFTWTIRVESDQQTDDGVADIIADRVKVRLQRRSTVDALRAAGMGIAGLGDIQPIDGVKVADRVLNVRVFDVKLNAVENDADDTAGAGNWIERAVIDSDTLEGVDGNDLPAPEQVHVDVTRG